MMTATTGRVPLLDDDGRFPDRFTPQAALDAVTDAEAHASDAASSKDAAASSASDAVAAKNAAAATAAAIPTTNDAIMTTVAGDPDSDFARQQSTTFVAGNRKVNGKALSADVTLASGDVGAAPATSVPVAPVATSTKSYDTRTGLYNLKPYHFRKWRARSAAARGGTGIAKLACIGDSLTAGQTVNLQTQAWPVLLRQLLVAAGQQLSGTGPVLPQSSDTGYDPRWTAVGTWNKFTTGGFKTLLRYNGTAGNTLTFTSDLSGTVVDLWYSNASGPFTVTIDSGSAVAVTPAGGATLGKYTVTGLSDTTHVVKITVTSGTTYAGPCDVHHAAGIEIANLGEGGALANDGYAGNQPYGASNFTTAAWVADAVTIAFMTNEAAQAIPAATFKTNVTAIVTAMQTAGIDVLLIAQIPIGSTYDLTTYRTALYQIADTKDVPLLDMSDRWGTWTLANTLGLMTDTYHPTAAGYDDYSRAVNQALTV